MQFTEPARYDYLPDTPPSQKENLDSSFIDENDNNVPYTKLPRKYGDGELRLGTYLTLNEDVYSLGFASLIKNELIDKVLLEVDEQEPKTRLAVTKTPRGSSKVIDMMNADNHQDDEDQIYEDEQLHNEWE